MRVLRRPGKSAGLDRIHSLSSSSICVEGAPGWSRVRFWRMTLIPSRCISIATVRRSSIGSRGLLTPYFTWPKTSQSVDRSLVRPPTYRRRVTLADGIVALIEQRGPLGFDAAAGLLETSARQVMNEVRDPRLFPIEGRLHLSGDVLDGRVFTVRPNDDGSLDLYPDLAMLSLPKVAFTARDEQGRTAPVDVDDNEQRCVIGELVPPDGGLVALRIVDAVAGVLEVTPTQPREPEELEIARVKGALDELCEDPDDGLVGVDVHIATRVLCADQPALFARAGVTFSQLVRAAGFEIYRDEAIVPEGVYPSGWDEIFDETFDEEAVDYPDDEAFPTVPEFFGPRAVRFEEIIAAGPPFDADEVEELLRDPQVLELIFGVAVRFPDHIETVSDPLLALSPDHGPALQAKAAVALARGDADAAEELLQRGLDKGISEDGIEKLAELRSERGDARGAIGLLRSLGVDEDDAELVRLLAVEARPAGAGRNEPCPCGSGKKFKRCCGDPTKPPSLPDRITWLLGKLLAFSHDARFRRIRVHTISAMYREPDVETLGDGILADALLHTDVAPGCPLLDRFIAERGHRLPSDERELLEQWRSTELVLAEVVSSKPGHGLSLRPMGGDDIVEVRERSGSRTLRPGDVLLTRIVPDGVEHQLLLTLQIPRSSRARVATALRQGHIELARTMEALRTGPILHTTDGQELAFVSTKWLVADGADSLLDRAFERTGDASWHWLTSSDKVAATLELAGNVLTVETSSHERSAGVEVLLGDVALDLLDYDVKDPGELPAGPAVREAPAPEMLAALRQHMEELERRWVDKPVPALGGRTPREAAADPEGARELEELLRDFEAQPGGGDVGGFDVARLRRLLAQGAS